MGYEKLFNKIPDLEPFDGYILQHFMEGVSIKNRFKPDMNSSI